MKKRYFAPELEILILEQADIITNSPTTGGGKDNQDESYEGGFDNWG